MGIPKGRCANWTVDDPSADTMDFGFGKLRKHIAGGVRMRSTLHMLCWPLLASALLELWLHKPLNDESVKIKKA